jgi:hypothetical protein
MSQRPKRSSTRVQEQERSAEVDSGKIDVLPTKRKGAIVTSAKAKVASAFDELREDLKSINDSNKQVTTYVRNWGRTYGPTRVHT